MGHKERERVRQRGATGGREGGSGDRELRILLTAGNETALVTFMLRRGSEGQTHLDEYMVRVQQIDDLKDA